MEKNPVDIGYPPGTQPTPAEVQEANRSIRRLRPAVDATRAEVARAAGAIRDTLGSTAATVRSSAQDRAAELVAYTRQRPATALMMATGLGLLAGVSLAIGSRSAIGARVAWLPRRTPRRGVVNRLTGLSWTGVPDWIRR